MQKKTSMVVSDTTERILDIKDPQVLKDLKEMYAGKNINQTEFMMFLKMIESLSLNPFKREIYLIKYGSQAASIVIARDGYRRMAQEQAEYDYHIVDAIYSKDDFRVENGQPFHKYSIVDSRGELFGAWCVVKRKSSSREMFVVVKMKEYENLNNPSWKKYPETMIKKVAEGQALKMAFQGVFAGTYIEGEMDEDETTVQKPNPSKEKAITVEATTAEPLNTVFEAIEELKNCDTEEQFNDFSNNRLPKLLKEMSKEEKTQVKEFYDKIKVGLDAKKNLGLDKPLEEKSPESQEPVAPETKNRTRTTSSSSGRVKASKIDDKAEKEKEEEKKTTETVEKEPDIDFSEDETPQQKFVKECRVLTDNWVEGFQGMKTIDGVNKLGLSTKAMMSSFGQLFPFKDEIIAAYQTAKKRIENPPKAEPEERKFSTEIPKKKELPTVSMFN